MLPIFETERLIVRRWTPDDVEAAFELYRDPAIYGHLPGQPLASREAAAGMLARLIARYPQATGLGWFVALLREDRSFVGSIGIRVIPNDSRIEIGFHILPAYWRRGFGSELVRGLVTYGFGQLGLDAIHALVAPGNGASVRALEKAGLREIERGQFWDADEEEWLMRITREPRQEVVDRSP